jgi:hypothetical protein
MKWRSKRTAGFLIVLGLILVVVVWTNSHLNYRFRWLMSRNRYKSLVLAQPEPSNHQLRHIEWDGWGWGGADTLVYLVFDPSDGLATKRDLAVKYKYIPCDMDSVLRMEKQWYTVRFFTDTTWTDCRP